MSRSSSSTRPSTTSTDPPSNRPAPPAASAVEGSGVSTNLRASARVRCDYRVVFVLRDFVRPRQGRRGFELRFAVSSPRFCPTAPCVDDGLEGDGHVLRSPVAHVAQGQRPPQAPAVKWGSRTRVRGEGFADVRRHVELRNKDATEPAMGIARRWLCVFLDCAPVLFVCSVELRHDLPHG